MFRFLLTVLTRRCNRFKLLCVDFTSILYMKTVSRNLFNAPDPLVCLHRLAKAGSTLSSTISAPLPCWAPLQCGASLHHRSRHSIADITVCQKLGPQPSVSCCNSKSVKSKLVCTDSFLAPRAPDTLRSQAVHDKEK